MSNPDEKLTRIAIVAKDKCKPKRCRQECKKSCPVVRMGAPRFSASHVGQKERGNRPPSALAHTHRRPWLLSLILKVKFSHVLINVSLTGALVGVRADLLLSGPLPLFLLPQLQYSRVLELKFVYDDILSSLGKMCIEVGPDSKMAEIRSERLASRRLAFFF